MCVLCCRSVILTLKWTKIKLPLGVSQDPKKEIEHASY